MSDRPQLTHDQALGALRAALQDARWVLYDDVLAAGPAQCRKQPALAYRKALLKRVDAVLLATADAKAPGHRFRRRKASV